MKIDRTAILSKTNNRCAYCGCNLLDKKWHIDHMIPVTRNPYTKIMLHKENHNIGNLYASCISCNMNKGGLDVDYYRDVLGRYMDRSEVKTLLRLGIFKLDNWPVKFYYETLEGTE